MNEFIAAHQTLVAVILGVTTSILWVVLAISWFNSLLES